MTPALATRFFDEDIAVEKVIWLVGCVAHLSDDFKELVEDDPAAVYAMVGVEQPAGDEDVSADDVFTDLQHAGRFGFLVQVATPVVYASGQSSWGHYYAKWFYTETIDETLLDLAVSWRAALPRCTD